MILIKYLDYYINQLILDYYSNFNTFDGMYNAIRCNSQELVNYFVNKEKITDGLQDFMYFDGAQLSAAYNNCELVKYFVNKYNDEFVNIDKEGYNDILWQSWSSNNFEHVNPDINQFICEKILT